MDFYWYFAALHSEQQSLEQRLHAAQQKTEQLLTCISQGTAQDICIKQIDPQRVR
jgi:succinate dehydrogenase/fumarate reductase-like Fe-S protein